MSGLKKNCIASIGMKTTDEIIIQILLNTANFFDTDRIKKNLIRNFVCVSSIRGFGRLGNQQNKSYSVRLKIEIECH